MVHMDTRQLTCDEFRDYLSRNAFLQKKIFDVLLQIMVDKNGRLACPTDYWANKKKVINSYCSNLGFDVVGLIYRPYGIKVLCKDSKFLIYFKTRGSFASLVAKKVTR